MTKNLTNLLLLLGSSLAAQNAAWHELATTVAQHTAVWDWAGQRLVIVGPATNQRLWIWDGTEVRERLGAMVGQPTVHQLCHDRSQHEVVALGIATGTRYSVGRWRNGSWTWRTDAGAPEQAASTVAAYDDERGRLVVYRSTTNGSTLHEWDGQHWWLVANGTGPSGRTGAAFAYDPIGRRCVLYGGDDGSVLADTWSWDGFVWTQLAATSAPGPRTDAAMAFDSLGGRLVLHGGRNTPSTFVLAGNQWVALPTVGDAGEQFRHELIDSAQGLLLLPASYQARIFDFDTAGTIWRLLGNQWSPHANLPYPTPRNNVNFAYDPVRREVVGFGGTPTSTYPIPDRTLVFDRRWRPRTPATEPTLRFATPLCWSPIDQRVLMFGGDTFGPLVAETWLWDGSDWQQAQVAAAPPARSRHTLVAEPGGTLLLFGGWDGSAYLGDQWRWDGVVWTQLLPSVRPSARAVALAALDPLSSRVVLFGGEHQTPPVVAQDTWLWDGAVWTQAATTTAPTGVHSMAVEPASQRVVLAGTNGYEWTGTDWSPRASLGRSFTTQWTRIVGDPVHGRLLWITPPSVWLHTDRRATAASFGQGCAAIEPPRLTAIDEPALGVDFAVEVACLTDATPAFLIVGFGEQNQSLGGGCSSLVAQPLGTVLALTGPGGAARFPLAIPNVAALRGVQFVAQGAALEPARSTLGHVTLTAGLRIAIGD